MSLVQLLASEDSAVGSGSTAPTRDAVGPDVSAATFAMVRRVVRDIAARVPRSVEREELFAAGMLGVAQARRSYRPELGVPFDVHARGRVTGAILDDLRSRDWLTRPQRVRARAVVEAMSSLPTVLETDRIAAISHRTRMTGAEVHQTLADLDRAHRLQQASEITGSEGAADVAAPGADPLALMLDRELLEHVRASVAQLPPRLRAVVEGVYFEERQMQVIAAEMGVTPSRVSQLCAEALGRLKVAITSFDRESAVRRPVSAAAPAAARST